MWRGFWGCLGRLSRAGVGGGFLPHPAPSRNRGQAHGPPPGLRPGPQPSAPPPDAGSGALPRIPGARELQPGPPPQAYARPPVRGCAWAPARAPRPRRRFRSSASGPWRSGTTAWTPISGLRPRHRFRGSASDSAARGLGGPGLAVPPRDPVRRSDPRPDAEAPPLSGARPGRPAWGLRSPVRPGAPPWGPGSGSPPGGPARGSTPAPPAPALRPVSGARRLGSDGSDGSDGSAAGLPSRWPVRRTPSGSRCVAEVAEYVRDGGGPANPFQRQGAPASGGWRRNRCGPSNPRSRVRRADGGAALPDSLRPTSRFGGCRVPGR